MLQQLFNIVQEMVFPYPHSILLFFIGMINATWIVYVVFFRRQLQKNIHKAYLLFTLCVLFWVLGNAWAESKLLVSFGERGLQTTFIFVSMATTFAITVFFYISCLIRGANNKTSVVERIFIGLMIGQNLVLNLIPSLVIEKVEILSDGSFILVQTRIYSILYLFSIFAIIWGWVNVILAFRRASKEKRQLERIRFLFICIGASIMYGSSIIFHQILPYFFQNYNYGWIPPALSIFDVFIVGYGVMVERFPNIQFLVTRTIKRGLSFMLAAGLSYLLSLELKMFFVEASLLDSYILPFFVLLILYHQFLRFCYSKTFHHIFGTTSVEYFLQTINEFQKKNSIYRNLEEFERDMYQTFCVKLQIHAAKFIILDEKVSTLCPKLIKYCSKHREILVTKEIQFQQMQGEKKFSFLDELEQLGEICIPLTNPSEALIGFFILGRKPFDELYFKEELEVLERLQHPLSLEVTGILYSSELQKEVAMKTKDLERQNKKINRLLQQQADFIALSTHEFRTPLSVALFQLEDIVQSYEHEIEVSEGLENMQSALHDLKILTQRIFDVEQYDLDKVEIKKENVLIGEYLQRIYENFLPIMQEKGLSFDFHNHLTKDMSLYLDAQQIKQVLHNLLTNASKFTPRGRSVCMILKKKKSTIDILIQDTGEGINDKDKKHIFEKFKTEKLTKNTGMGFGLYICKKIVEIHEGKIKIEDTPGGGATFIVSLPIS